jgi:uncharacterized membrane protein
MMRSIAIAFVFTVGFLLLLAEVQRLDDATTEQITLQREYNAHQ